MELVQIFLWVVYPYSVAAIVGMGLVWQYDSAEDDGAESKFGRYLACTVKALMFLSTATGIAIVLSSSISNEPLLLLRLLISLAQLQPDMELVMNISTLSKVHFIVVFMFLLSMAFTKEIYYLVKPHLYVKKLYLKLHFEKRS